MANKDNTTEETFITMRSIMSDQEKENMELRKMLRRTDDTIARTKKHIAYLERLRVWTEHNLHEQYHR